MLIPNIRISDLLEPHASASLLQFCSRTFIRPIPNFSSKPPTKEQFKLAAVNNPPSPLSRFCSRPDFQPQFGTTFSLLPLYQRFTPLFPHSLPSFSGTSVLPFSWNVLLPSGTFPL